MSDLVSLAEEWRAAKTAEFEAMTERRRVEDELRAAMWIDATSDATTTAKTGGYVIRVVGRIDRKVDADLIQALAAEAGLSDHLPSLFRWKPEINIAAWKAADESITRPLAAAITAKPGRPSFTITLEK